MQKTRTKFASQIERTSPRITVNKMGEYLCAFAARRARIIYDAKYPKDFITTRYSKAETAIKDFFLNENKDSQLILQAIDQLSKQKPTNKHQHEVIYSCIEALTEFLKFIGDSDLLEDDRGFFDGISKSASMTISGVKISIRPEILIHDKKEISGGVKLYFSKSFPLSKTSSEYIGTLLMKYLEQEYQKPIKARNCFVIDIFNKTIYTAPKAYIKRLQDIEAACTEISNQWKFVQF
ncbi:hypothetical protein [Rufibacter aurantiacus]|uniref:hypothetical protein n=1 Tax=Rufibacter aurantiacus TaxID=2817374 RepID=UPI001B3061C5|nr:hypothetical protein [Rufibacter aurantiacus]